MTKRCTRLAAVSDKVYRLLAQGRSFFPSTPATSTTKTGHHDIAEILLKEALNTKNQNQNQPMTLLEGVFVKKMFIFGILLFRFSNFASFNV